MQLQPKLNVISIHGWSSSGKDTVANELHQQFDCRIISVADHIRDSVDQMTRIVRPSDDGQRTPNFYQGKSYKELLMEYGASKSMRDPYVFWHKVVYQLYDEFVAQCVGFTQPSRMIVMKDVRRPIEFDFLINASWINLWAIKLKPNPSSYKAPLDDILHKYQDFMHSLITPIQLTDDPNARQNNLNQIIEEIRLHIISSLPN